MLTFILIHDSLPSIIEKSTRTSLLPMHHEGNLMHANFHSIMKEITNALPKTTTLHHEEILACASFPYSTRKSALTKTTLHHKNTLTHATFPSITSINALP